MKASAVHMLYPLHEMDEAYFDVAGQICIHFKSDDWLRSDLLGNKVTLFWASLSPGPNMHTSQDNIHELHPNVLLGALKKANTPI